MVLIAGVYHEFFGALNRPPPIDTVYQKIVPLLCLINMDSPLP